MEEQNNQIPVPPEELANANNPENLDISQIINEAKSRQNAGQASVEDQQLLAVFELGASFGANQSQEHAESVSTDNLPSVELRTVDERTISNDLLGATNKRIDDVGAKIDTEAGWGDTSYLQTELKGHEDFRDYLMSRDYKDKKGNVHDAQTNSFKSEELANVVGQEQSDPSEDLNSLKLQGEDGLFKKWADAEDRDLSTVVEDVENELLRRLDSQEQLSDEQKMAYIDRMHAQMTKLRETEPTPETVADTVIPNAPEITPNEPTIEPSPETPDEIEEEPTIEPSPETPDEIEEEPTGPSAPEVEADKTQKFDQNVHEYVVAKVASERILAGEDDKRNLEEAKNALQSSFNELLGVIPESMRLADQMLQNSIDDNQALLNQAQERLAGIQSEIANPTTDNHGELNEQVAALEKEIQERQETAINLQETKERSAADAEAYMTQRVMVLRKTIDEASINERSRSRGIWGKVSNWLNRHPKARIGIGLGLTGLGFVGAASFNAPLIAIATGGKALLRGIGSYEVTRAAGELLATHRLDRSDMSTLESYLEASTRESQTRKNSKRLGVLIGAGMALGPLTSQLVESSQHLNMGKTPGHVGGNPTPTTSHSPVPSPAPEALNVQPIDGNTAPWTFGMNNLHTNISNPITLAKLVHNTAGIKFFGNGLGGGEGAITKVFIPGQGNFSDIGHINGAIQFLLEGKA